MNSEDMKSGETAMHCGYCSISLKEPFILCTKCHVRLCLNCFAKGEETANHSNDHPYEIKHLDFSIFDETWSASEELQLLDELEDKGHGNWQEICKRLPNKKSKDVEEHFSKHYIDTSNALQQTNIDVESFWRRSANYTEGSIPPRPDSNEMNELFLVGYMPARGDFVVEHDNFAECDINDVEFDDHANKKDADEDILIRELNVAMVDIYRTRLLERRMRRSLVRQYGLLDLTSTANTSLFAHGREERSLRDLFCKFTQLMKPEEHEKLLQSILYQRCLEKKIENLQEYRKLGLTCFRDAGVYEKFKCKRDRIKKLQTTKLDEVLLYDENSYACQVWLQRQMTGKKNASLQQIPQAVRKIMPPLDLSNLPKTNCLDDEEKKLCSCNRISPADYLSFRDTLQEESIRSNGIRLQTARNLFKIDVNKTKKLYEFLLQRDVIKSQ